ncbi:MAG: pilus assembly protein [Clostridiales bacterium]|jgi:hypothetical protein|nr:pilus assembly protein [Eubacteriales bacterium]MDH7565815.1 pilus assembly protein [Clostridiales bacterium]
MRRKLKPCKDLSISAETASTRPLPAKYLKGFVRDSQKGSIVVEASLIMPVILMCVFAVLYFAVLLYQQVCLRSIADRAVEAGKAFWDNPRKEMETGGIGKGDINGQGLYWRFFDTQKGYKLEKIKNYAEDTLNGGTGKKAYSAGGPGLFQNAGGEGHTEIQVDIKDYVIYKKLTVSIEETYRIPVGSLLKGFGIGESYRVKAESSAVFNDPVELIRDVDFLTEVEGEMEGKYPVLGEAAGKMRDTLRAVKEKILEMMNG